ncbi:MAG: hypothetical protein HY516_04145 [Candidatus Aenigmarchaeota archaeon]|nr:hypothetical protein [Candidatus Aenigmarchaeota archaeon]
MRTYDLHVHVSPFGGESPVDDMVKTASHLGWTGMALSCFSDNVASDYEKLVKSLATSDFDIVTAVEIKANNPNELHKTLDEVRKKFEIVIVRGGDSEVNRAAVETNQVDLLSHPEMQRNDSGLDLVMAKAAADNNVCIELNFRQILNSFRKSRVHTLAHMRQNLKLAKKYGFPVAITSGAYSKWELRAPRELAAFGASIGMDLEDSLKSLEAPKIDANRAKLKGSWVMPGVEMENG